MQWTQLVLESTPQSSLYQPLAQKASTEPVKHCGCLSLPIIDSYKDNMEPEELFEVISQCLLASVDRDAYSGWGGIVYIITPDRIIERRLKTRMD